MRIVLTPHEERTYLNPAKDVTDMNRLSGCPLDHSSVCTFLGRDLLKPSALVQKSRNIRREPIELRLLLLYGCFSPHDDQLLLQCRQHLINAFTQENSRCILSTVGSPHDEQDNTTIVIPSIRTVLYLFNPVKSQSDHLNSILYLEPKTLGAILDIQQLPIKERYVFEHTIERSNTRMYRDFFTIEKYLWQTTHTYYLFQLAEGCTARPKVLTSIPTKRDARCNGTVYSAP